MGSTFAIMALIGGSLTADVITAPTFHTDYAAAKQVGQKENKPLAVVVGGGVNGWRKLSGGDELGVTAMKRLSSNYVCVYADTETAAGKKLADKLEVRQTVGLVISDRSGNYQSYSHDGALPPTELDRTIEEFATVKAVTPPAIRSTSNYAPEMSAPAMTMQPAMSAPAMYYPGMSQPSMGYYPSVGGCASGNCGTSYYPSASYYPSMGGCASGNCPSSYRR